MYQDIATVRFRRFVIVALYGTLVMLSAILGCLIVLLRR